MKMTSIAIFFATSFILSCVADIKVMSTGNRQFEVLWNDKPVLVSSKQISKLTSKFVIVDKKCQKINLGIGKFSIKKTGKQLVVKQEFANSNSHWSLSLTPAGENGIDLVYEIKAASNQWLKEFKLNVLNLCMKVSKDKKEHLIAYPAGKKCYVPALVLQDENTVAGVYRLNVHNNWRTDYNELSLINNDKSDSYSVLLSSGKQFGQAYKNSTKVFYRFRFAKSSKKNSNQAAKLMDFPMLWSDYVKELKSQVPLYPFPTYDKSKNNIIILNFFMAEAIFVSPKNPQGWIMNEANWKDNPWEWKREKINSKMSDAEVKRRSGFSSENFGKPKKWVKPFAERCVREMRETNSQAMLVFRSAINPDNNYLPESHHFSPDLEELLPIKGKIRNWDWAVTNIKLKDSSGKLIASKENVLIHVADKTKLVNPGGKVVPRQLINLKINDIKQAGKRFVKQARLCAKDRLIHKYILNIEIASPFKKLFKLSNGDNATLSAFAKTKDTVLSSENLKLEINITGIQRAAIDVWAKTLIDNDIEFGFLVREAMTIGQPWKQWLQTCDWRAEWQFRMFKQRIKHHRARFGKKCRWFYLDEFGINTPQFVFEMLRNEFPDCIMFAGHPYDVSDRIIPGFHRNELLTNLEKYIAPNVCSLIPPESMFTSDKKKNIKLLKHLWKNPNYFMTTHRGARKFVKMIKKNKHKVNDD